MNAILTIFLNQIDEQQLLISIIIYTRLDKLIKN